MSRFPYCGRRVRGAARRAAAVSICGAALAARGASIDAFTYADDAAAGMAWAAQGGTAAVSTARVQGRRALRMPCNFRGTATARACWDRVVDLDLAMCRGLAFMAHCPDRGPVSHFSIYLHSGDGWYLSTFPGGGARGWSLVEIHKSATTTEGRPAGWARIDKIRISAWRGADRDTELFISDMRTLGGAQPLALVRAESAAVSQPGEAGAIRTYTRVVARHLDALGVPFVLLSDYDLAGARLSGCRAVILPHSPDMPPAALRSLAAFMDRGGKLLAFYNLAAQLQPAAGIRAGRHVKQDRSGHFASIRRSGTGLAGLPALVTQHSWNIRQGFPTSRSRVAAYWHDADGNNTGEAAILVSDRCVLMTHVLVPGDARAQRLMLTAMLGHLVPGTWRTAAGHCLDAVGQFGPFTTTSRAVEILTARAAGNAVARAALGLAAASRARAGEDLRSGRFASALESAWQARGELVRAYAAVQEPGSPEFRAAWCHSAFGVEGMDWDRAAEVLAENGFSAVLPNMAWGGVADYESRVLPVSPEVATRGDQVARCLAACRKHGLECHVWKINWKLGHRVPREFALRMKRAGRTQVGYDGTPRDDWLCPSHPANRELEIEAMLEIARRYEVDGIHFDYIRFPGENACFCSGCRGRFEAIAGRRVRDWPAAVRAPGGTQQRWLDFRREQITRVVRTVSRKAREIRPGISVSAAVFTNWETARDSVGQDWKVWCERGYLDFVCPMDYTTDDVQFENQVRRQLGWAGQVPCYPGIGLSTWRETDGICRLIAQVGITRRLRCGGFTVFEYDAPAAVETVPLCGLGLTRE